MNIQRIGRQASTKQPAANFVGQVRRDSFFQSPDQGRIAFSTVTFEPGARTNWHTHLAGQALIIVSGCGWVQSWGGAREEVRPGDIVWFAPGEKHWHGAAAATGMSHIAISELVDGQSAEWLEPVSDEQFGGQVIG